MPRLLVPLLAALAAASPAAAQTGGEIYKAKCAQCHDSGAQRAPRLGVVADWEKRVDKGRPAMIRNALGVTPHATSKEIAEVTAAVDFLLSTVDILVNSYSEPPRIKSGR